MPDQLSSGGLDHPATGSDRRTFLKKMGFGLAGLGLSTSAPPVYAAASAGAGKLPRSTPEAQGVHSAGIVDFLRAVAGSKHEFHSFMMARHGHVIAAGWWTPYRPELRHMLYSLSKSFTSSAVGLAETEGKLSIEEPVISFFPGKLPAEVSEHLRVLRVEHLLTMSVGHAQDSTPLITQADDWVKAFLELPIPHAPGTEFLYNSGATYMLSAIVQKVTGQRVLDYLTPRLFEPLKIQGMTWETCPHGINTGGWGLSLRTEDLAKFAQLYLQEGAWNGRPVLPSRWVRQATRFKIQQPGRDLDKLKRESDWHQGYCYQFWRCRHNGFRGDGAFGQYAIVLPEQDAVIAITSESSNMQGELNLVWEHLLPAIQPNALAPDRRAAGELNQALRDLSLSPPKGQASPGLAARISGKAYRIGEGSGFHAVTFQFGKHECVFTAQDAKGTYPISCGLERWITGKTTMPGTPPTLTKSLPGIRSTVAASGAWKDAQTFEMTWRFIETPHHETVTCRFQDSEVKIDFSGSVAQLAPSRRRDNPTLVGRTTA